LGKQDTCQVAVTLSLANRTASLPVAYRLYLPQEWADDPVRRQTAGVPEEITFQTKPEIALDQIRAAAGAGLPRGVVLMDAGYGSDTQLRTDITARASPRAGSATWRGSCQTPRFGRRAVRRCHPSPGRAGDDHPS
jgi:SRSO17 transposase